MGSGISVPLLVLLSMSPLCVGEGFGLAIGEVVDSKVELIDSSNRVTAYSRGSLRVAFDLAGVITSMEPSLSDDSRNRTFFVPGLRFCTLLWLGNSDMRSKAP